MSPVLRLRGLPGVSAVGSIDILPLSTGCDCSPVWAEDRALPPHGERLCPEIRIMDEGYPSVAKLVVVRGRGFRSADRAPDSGAVLINQRLGSRPPYAPSSGRSTTSCRSRRSGPWKRWWPGLACELPARRATSIDPAITLQGN